MFCSGLADLFEIDAAVEQQEVGMCSLWVAFCVGFLFCSFHDEA